MRPQKSRTLKLFLCGDVMTGRGIDQALPYPGSPRLHETHARDAREYWQLAERVHGPIERPLSFQYIWGDALVELERAGIDLRIVNLETSITRSEAHWPGKAIHYRMHPRNIGCLTAARLDACCLANNHVLDWGHPGLAETLQTLDSGPLAHAGAGRTATEAAAPAVLRIQGGGRVLLFAFGSSSSGIPEEWRATDDRPGVNLLEDLSEATAQRVVRQMRQFQREGDLLAASVHWGGNWGYDVPRDQIAFAHRLVDEGVSIVHGHSSHHVKAMEVYQDRLILYGCGDFLTDYEGISGYEWFRGDLALMYLVEMDARHGRVKAVRLVPLQSRRFRLCRAATADAQWLGQLLERLGKPFGTNVERAEDGSLRLTWT